MILNRRTFLKALGAIGLVPVLPSIKFAPNDSTPNEVEDFHIDEPVTITNPLAHLVINGIEIPVVGMSVEYTGEHDWRDYGTGVKVYHPTCQYYTISFRTSFENYQKISSQKCKKLSFIVRPKYSNLILSGEAYIINESMSVSPRDFIYCDMTIQSDGVIEVRNKNEIKYIS